tara:strand:- start:6349 stop:7230 length:882 start_codon:yes stop_codon:yes gene_type:complete
MKPLFALVVLHYKTWWDTIECVDSMLATNYSNKHIIIVNNDEDEVSQKKLAERYHTDPQITLLKTGKNLGFSRGNNLGFQHAKYELKASFIVLSNNDIVLPDDNIIDDIIDKYRETPFDILGPKIISNVDQLDQNPRDELYDSISNVKKFISNFRWLLWLSYLKIDLSLVSWKKKIFPISKLPSYNTDLDHETEQWEVKLHGSFLVFASNYIEQYEGLYPIKTMQLEESILNFIAKRDNLRTVYFPSSKVYHKEDSATNYVYGKGVKKRRFYYRNCLASCKELLKLMKNENKK